MDYASISFVAVQCGSPDLSAHSDYNCASWAYKFSEEVSEIFDGLWDFELIISIDAKMLLVYIARYVTRNDKVLSENDLLKWCSIEWGSLSDRFCM